MCVWYWMNCGRSTEGKVFESDLSALMKCHKDERGVTCVCVDAGPVYECQLNVGLDV